MGTSAGKGPAVVQGPDDRDMMLFDVSEQHRQVQAEAVDIMEVDHIRSNAVQLLQQLPGCAAGKAAVFACEDTDGYMGQT